jgi:hypothetical protein
MRCQRTLFCAVLIGCLGAGGLARAQQAISMPGDEKLPTAPVDDGRRIGWVTFANLRPLSQAKRGSEPALGEKPFEFRQPVVVLYDAQKNSGLPFLLVGTTEGRVITGYYGWIERKYVLESQRAMTDPETTIALKAMIVTPSDVVERMSQGEVKRTSPFREAPSAGAAIEGQFPWFQYLFVYAKVDGFVLVGNAPEFSPSGAQNGPRQVLSGWLAVDDVCEWKTREAFWWDHTTVTKRSKSPGQIYEDVKQAYAAAAGDPIEARFLERPGAEPPPPTMSRFPRLEWPRGKKAPRDEDTNNLLQYVGWVGSSKSSSLDAPELQQLQHVTELLQQQLNKIDVLILIDDTSSMNPWFAHIQKIVEQIRTEVKEASVPVRISICYFNDRNQRTGKHDPMRSPLALLGTPEASRQMAELAQHKEGSDASGKQVPIDEDPCEMLFDGMRLAIQTAAFNDDAYKLMIVIGVHGDKSAVDKARLRVDTDAEEKKLAKLLKPGTIRPIELHAIQVCETPEDGDKEKKAFEEQLRKVLLFFNDTRREIAKAAAESEKPYADAPEIAGDVGGFLRSHDDKQVAEAVVGRFRSLKEKNREILARLQKAIVGDWSTEFGPELLRQFKNQNIDVDKIRREQPILSFQRGYVWEYLSNGRDKPVEITQLRPWVLLSELELSDLVGMLDRVLGGVHGLRKVSLKDVVEQEIIMLAGDARPSDPKTTSFAAAAKRHGLIIRSKFLNTTVEELADGIPPDEYKLLRLKTNKLKDVLDGVQSSWAEKRDRLPNGSIVINYERGEQTPLSRVYTIPGSNAKWYWLDELEEMP